MTSERAGEPQPLRIAGGYEGAVRRALATWWSRLFMLIGLNLLWGIALVTVVALPPATAAIYAVAREGLEGDPYVGWESFAAAFRRTWRAAWLWALGVALVGGAAAGNLWIYREAQGALWDALRWFWATLLVIWLAINLFFWPFWFAQDDEHRSLRLTWRNALAFLAHHPLVTLATLALTLALATGSLMTGVLLGTVFMVWAALLATAVLAAYLPAESA